MKLLVPTKRVPDTDYKIRVKEDGSGIDEQNLPYVINPFDAIALEEALRIREASADEVEVVILGIGRSDDYEKELRTPRPDPPRRRRSRTARSGDRGKASGGR